ncbi:hypothetical protein J6590_058827 [Homalodisca vitripennis]|nr:hypothetical protein J6590_058827 [Homalodisca vitripennis]
MNNNHNFDFQKMAIKMAVGDEVENCPCCKLIVNESDIALNCDGFCKEWYHGSCVKISSVEYDKLTYWHLRNANTVTNAVDDVLAATNPITKLDNGLGADRFPKVSSRLSANISDGKSKGNKMNRNRTFTNSTSEWKVINYHRKRGLQSAVSNNSSVSEEQENLTNTKSANISDGKSKGNKMNRNRTFTNSTSEWKVVNYHRKRGLQSAVSNNSSVSVVSNNSVGFNQGMVGCTSGVRCSDGVNTSQREDCRTEPLAQGVCNEITLVKQDIDKLFKVAYYIFWLKWFKFSTKCQKCEHCDECG